MSKKTIEEICSNCKYDYNNNDYSKYPCDICLDMRFLEPKESPVSLGQIQSRPDEIALGHSYAELKAEPKANTENLKLWLNIIHKEAIIQQGGAFGVIKEYVEKCINELPDEYKCNRCNDTGRIPVVIGDRQITGYTNTCPDCPPKAEQKMEEFEKLTRYSHPSSNSPMIENEDGTYIVYSEVKPIINFLFARIQKLQSKKYITLVQAREMALFSAEKVKQARKWVVQDEYLQTLKAENENLKKVLIEISNHETGEHPELGKDHACPVCSKIIDIADQALKEFENE